VRKLLSNVEQILDKVCRFERF